MTPNAKLVTYEHFMKQEELSRWIRSLIVAAVVFILWTVYLVIRRGYLNLYIFNKVFGSAAAVVVALTLLIGPLSRRWPYLTKFMTIRKHLGLTAFGLALLHTVTSLFFLPDHFPLNRLLGQWFPMLVGLVAIIIWVYLASISRNAKILAMGSDLWKRHQQTGAWIAFIAIYLHLVVMKYQGWFRWARGEVKASPELANPSYVPASLFVLAVMTGVLVYRGFLLITKRKDVRKV